MGLLWFSEQKFGDFILDFEYKCERPETNSGVFIRIPEIPVNNDYIYHSFEIQINDVSKGIHHSGAAYDAEAPSRDNEKATGQWNHMKITFKGNRLQVELNASLILD